MLLLLLLYVFIFSESKQEIKNMTLKTEIISEKYGHFIISLHFYTFDYTSVESSTTVNQNKSRFFLPVFTLDHYCTT